MAERSFARLGYKDASGNFVGTDTRAREVIATNGISAEAHITNAAAHLTSEQSGRIAGAVQSGDLIGEDGKVLATKLPSQALTVADSSVTDIPALLALSATQAPINADIFVSNATGDNTVKSGWALYRRKATAGNTLADWTKLSEGEGLDVAMVDQTARDAAQTAQGAANSAATTAQLLDAVYCVSEADMASKNLRTGAIVLMAVDNS